MHRLNKSLALSSQMKILNLHAFFRIEESSLVSFIKGISMFSSIALFSWSNLLEIGLKFKVFIMIVYIFYS